jgi:hypothetical protein
MLVKFRITSVEPRLPSSEGQASTSAIIIGVEERDDLSSVEATE